jgi:tetratricopeptide (TPR) repeat protein
MFWPTTLVPFYPHSQQPVPVAATIAAVALLLALTLFAFVIRKKWPYVTVGWFWYVGMLVPVIGVVQVGWQARADRYTYLPQIGLYIAITWIAADLAPRLRLPRLSVAICAAAVVAVLASVSFLQAAYWRDSEKLWNHTLAVTPQNDVAENNLGIVLLARGREDEAIAHYEAALRLRPQNVPAHINLANALIHRGAVSDSIAHLRAALEFDPDNADAGNLLGVLLMRRGDIGSALEQWNKTLQANSDNGNARGNLAWVYATHPDPAIRDGRRGLRLAKEAAEIAGGRNAFVLRTLAAAYAENGRFEDAIGTARAAREVAIEQKNTGLVTELDATIRLYEAHVPLRDRSLPQRSSASG